MILQNVCVLLLSKADYSSEKYIHFNHEIYQTLPGHQSVIPGTSSDPFNTALPTFVSYIT